MPRDTSPALRRLRSAVLDPRLIIGVLLVAGSAAGVVAIVSAADETVDVYVAASSLATGDRVTAEDLIVQGVGLAQASSRYLVPGELPEEGVILTRPLAEGELVPDSAVGNASGARLSSVVVAVPGALAASIASGASVDLWAAREEESGRYGTPVVLVGAATVVRLVSTDSIVGSGDVAAVELLVPKASVARVLEAIANGAAISLVPTSIPLAR